MKKSNELKLWFEKADHDLSTAIITFKHIKEFNDTILFHCQQTVEKLLKCYLLFNNIPINRTHNLNYLLILI